MPTEAKDIFEAHSRSLRELLSENGLGFYLPPYQRPYGWSKDKVEKLIDDTLHGLANLGKTSDSFTFLGTVITIHDVNHTTVQPVVKTEVPAKVLTVIDGQQRISSLLMLIVCLHNMIRQSHWMVFKGSDPAADNEALTNLHEETIVLLKSLGSAFYEKHQIGDSPLYPRLIRAFDDQWAKKVSKREYNSPIAHLLFSYSVLADGEIGSSAQPTDFRPKARTGVGEGEADLTRRFSEMRSILSDLAKNKEMDDFEALPPMKVLADNTEFQKALFSHELEDNFCRYLKTLDEGPEIELVRLVTIGSYVLNRIAITVVKGKDEDYAFTIFESLNTTGEPLTAFETFLPRVVMAEGLGEYQNSAAHLHISAVQTYLSQFAVGDRLQTATRDLLVTFALAESGAKLSKRLADQRGYMKDSFEHTKGVAENRRAFLRHLRDTSVFMQKTWSPDDADRELAELGTAAMTNDVRLCLSFLKALNHTIAIAPLVRFYSTAIQAQGAEGVAMTKEFENALKAITAFTVYWRSSRRGTANIDREYREIMAGVNAASGMPPLARCPDQTSTTSTSTTTPSVKLLKSELAARLMSSDHGDIPSLDAWITASSSVPIYKVNKDLTRFLLLAAYHDTVVDKDSPGLIRAGRDGASPCLNIDGWNDTVHMTIEHIAPQANQHGWSVDLYTEKDTIHQIGNLVLSPGGANSSLSSRPWSEKRVLYAALGAPSQADATKLLDSASQEGVTFGVTTNTLVNMSRHTPHLSSLGMRTTEWDSDFLADRSRCLLELVNARLVGWLGLDWPDAAPTPTSGTN
ncbi:DUF262 domain-containing HNH endonuclease family protein [Rhodococcus sp. MEB041]|uniref:DUF262 domain-containing protein n=1 Tax=Rhodococcus sp. MEB041 TaxID=3040323 RepID=UPI00254CD17B|nr:DUF262 domain-containing HNH endonuclease family protein [Rhodococcus sp. MEB041]